MRVAIHQPEHLPWPNFFRKLACSDLFVVLDSVQFRKNYFQNRNKLLGRDGVPFWITAPISRSPYDTKICDMRLSHDQSWRNGYIRKLSAAYSGSEGMSFVGEELIQIVRESDNSLANLNLSLIKLLMKKLGIQTPIVLSSSLELVGSKSDLNLDICRKLGATSYLAGAGSIGDYLKIDDFLDAGITVESFPVALPEYGESRGSHGLSVVDLLMIEGQRTVAYFEQTSSDSYWKFLN